MQIILVTTDTCPECVAAKTHMKDGTYEEWNAYDNVQFCKDQNIAKVPALVVFNEHGIKQAKKFGARDILDWYRENKIGE